MRKVREVLRLRFEVGCSHRAIQASTGLSKGSVSDYLKRAATRSLTWAEASSMSDADVEARLFRTPCVNRVLDGARRLPQTLGRECERAISSERPALPQSRDAGWSGGRARG
jgi:hypothetical protein